MTVKSRTAHSYVAMFERSLSSDRRMMPWTFYDVISNGSRVIVLTDKQTNTQTDTTENSTIPPSQRYATRWSIAHETDKQSNGKKAELKVHSYSN